MSETVTLKGNFWFNSLVIEGDKYYFTVRSYPDARLEFKLISPTVFLYYSEPYNVWAAIQFDLNSDQVTEYFKVGVSVANSNESMVLADISNGNTSSAVSGTYSGKLPIQKINDMRRDRISSQMNELYRVQGSNAYSLESNYQSTLMVGLFVAMFGTTVLFYTFRQL